MEKMSEQTEQQLPPGVAIMSAWLTAEEAAARARCGVKVIYRAVKNKRLKATLVDRRRTLRFKPEWVDEWLGASVTIM
jgi:excisionase family DNA binding protein